MQGHLIRPWARWRARIAPRLARALRLVAAGRAAALAIGALLAAAASATDDFSASRDDARLRFDAELAIVDSEVPPGPEAHWTPVSLPDSWRHPARWQQGVNGWYRWRLRGPAPAPPQAVYLWRFSMNAAVFFNGSPIGDGGSFDEPVARNWNRPLLLRLPAAAWRDGDNELHVRLRVYPGYGHLMPVAIGPLAELQPDRDWRQFVQVTLGQMAAGITGLALLAGLTLWFVQRREPAALYFVGCCALWILYALNTFVRDIPVPARAWWAMVHAAVDGFYFFVIGFHHRVFGVRRPRIEAVVGATGLACGLFYAVADLPAIARWNPVLHGTTGLAGVYLLAWLLVQAWRHRTGEAMAFALSFAVVLGCAAHDQLLNAIAVPDLWRSHFYVAHLAVPLMFLVLMAHLARRVARGVQALHRENRDLTGRVQAADEQIAAIDARQRALVAEQGAAAERERIYRDLHDSLGARLLSLVYSARDERQATLARDALAEMRTLIASSRQPGGWLHDLATEWRVETELRCEDAGWTLDWRCEGEVWIGARQRHPLEAILRELVSNALEHAGGRQLAVHWRADGGRLALEVVDDGVGLSGRTPDGDRVGLGLPGLRERAATLGGHMQWLPGPGGGTRARVDIPLPTETGVAPNGPPHGEAGDRR